MLLQLQARFQYFGSKDYCNCNSTLQSICAMFFGIFLVCLSLSARVTPSALPSINTTNLQPFAITSLSTHTPNGMAGSSPYAQFLVSITNPNTIRLPTTRWGDRNFSSS